MNPNSRSRSASSRKRSASRRRLRKSNKENRPLRTSGSQDIKDGSPELYQLDSPRSDSAQEAQGLEDPELQHEQSPQEPQQGQDFGGQIDGVLLPPTPPQNALGTPQDVKDIAGPSVFVEPFFEVPRHVPFSSSSSSQHRIPTPMPPSRHSYTSSPSITPMSRQPGLERSGQSSEDQVVRLGKSSTERSMQDSGKEEPVDMQTQMHLSNIEASLSSPGQKTPLNGGDPGSGATFSSNPRHREEGDNAAETTTMSVYPKQVEPIPETNSTRNLADPDKGHDSKQSSKSRASESLKTDSLGEVLPSAQELTVGMSQMAIQKPSELNSAKPTMRSVTPSPKPSHISSSGQSQAAATSQVSIAEGPSQAPVSSQQSYSSSRRVRKRKISRSPSGVSSRSSAKRLKRS